WWSDRASPQVDDTRRGVQQARIAVERIDGDYDRAVALNQLQHGLELVCRADPLSQPLVARDLLRRDALHHKVRRNVAESTLDDVLSAKVRILLPARPVPHVPSIRFRDEPDDVAISIDGARGKALIAVLRRHGFELDNRVLKNLEVVRG